jgi:hypothetical protein
MLGYYEKLRALGIRVPEQYSVHLVSREQTPELYEVASWVEADPVYPSWCLARDIAGVGKRVSGNGELGIDLQEENFVAGEGGAVFVDFAPPFLRSGLSWREYLPTKREPELVPVLEPVFFGEFGPIRKPWRSALKRGVGEAQAFLRMLEEVGWGKAATFLRSLPAGMLLEAGRGRRRKVIEEISEGAVFDLREVLALFVPQATYLDQYY